MATAVEICAPAEQTEGTRSQVLRWLKKVGETVTENEPLIEIETDKVTVEVASPGTGVLREIVKGEQEEIAPGEVLGRIEAEGGVAVEESRGFAGDVDSVVGKGADARAGIKGADGALENVAGGGGESAGLRGAPHAGLASALNAAAGDGSVRAGVKGAAAARAAASMGGTGGGPRAAAEDRYAVGRLSPAVRRLLSENAIEPSSVHGTGQGGRITVEDVLAAIASQSGAAKATVTHGAGDAPRATRVASQLNGAGAEALAPSASVMPSGSAGATAATTSAAPEVAGGSRRIPHTAMRKRIAEHMVQSLLHTAPHVTTVFEADMTSVLAHRLQHRDEFARRSVPLTLTAYFLQAIVDAIRAVPEANSRWTDSALEVFDSVHVGVGTSLEEGGLVVPVLRDVQSRDLFATAEGLNDLVTRAREGRLTPADVRGGTFTISNHGVSGSLVATPIIINQPQSAILGIGKLEKRPVVVEEQGEDRVAIRPRCYVTLTIDHRVMDGYQANLFLQTFVARLTNWA